MGFFLSQEKKVFKKLLLIGIKNVQSCSPAISEKTESGSYNSDTL